MVSAIRAIQGKGEGEDALKEVLKHRIRPKLMEGEKPTPKLPSKLKTYAKHKIIFVLQDGKWRFGKLSEYNDRAEWKEALTKEGL
jgi:hypothetical protein